MDRSASEAHPFFVYGTLLPGQPNEHYWRGAIRSVEPAVFENGNLYDMGYYPMLVEEGGGNVTGKLVSVANGLYRDVLDRLDDLEGYLPDEPSKSSYRRVKREVSTQDRQSRWCWLYVGLRDQTDNCQLVSNGNWEVYVSRINRGPVNWWDTIGTVLGDLERFSGSES